MDSDNNQIQIQEELLLAKQSRIEGNEGRARVCARRAAGAAVKVYLEQMNLASKSDSVLRSLEIFHTALDLPDRISSAVGRLIQRVDEEHNLPDEIDLIHEAYLVLDFLAGIDPGINGDARE